MVRNTFSICRMVPIGTDANPTAVSGFISGTLQDTSTIIGLITAVTNANAAIVSGRVTAAYLTAALR